jgi:histidyl-tRNA synthetase
LRERYREVLKSRLAPQATELSEASQRRLGDNPLRILDSKSPRDQELVSGAPAILDLLDDEDRAHWDALREHLTALAVPFQVAPRLVRGLDYYTRTLFEVQSSSGELGAQNALGGGGRYDAMIHSLGGPDIPAIGFAIGLDRVLLALPSRAVPPPVACFVAPLGARAALEATVLARELRSRGVRTDVDTRGSSLKAMLRRAGSEGARLCVLIGDRELDQGVVRIKHLDAHSEEEVARDVAVDAVASRLAPEGKGAN